MHYRYILRICPFIAVALIAHPAQGSIYYDTGGAHHGSGGSVAYVTQGNTWAGGAGGPATITYSFSTANYATGESGAGGTTLVLNLANTGISAANWQTQIVAALNAWATPVNAALGGGTLVFNLVADSNTAFNAGGATGDIRFAGHTFDGAGGTLAHAYYPPPNGTSAAGDTHFDVADNYAVSSIDGNLTTIDIFQVAAHEIGHALGLEHTSVPNSLMNPIYSESFTGPQADDIAGAIDIFNGGGMVANSSAPEPITISLSLIGLASLIRRARRNSTQTA